MVCLYKIGCGKGVYRNSIWCTKYGATKEYNHMASSWYCNTLRMLTSSHCMSKKQLPIQYCNLLYKMGNHFLYTRYRVFRAASVSCPTSQTSCTYRAGTTWPPYATFSVGAAAGFTAAIWTLIVAGSIKYLSMHNFAHVFARPGKLLHSFKFYSPLVNAKNLFGL